MSRRIKLRERYIEGWYEMDADKILSSVTDDFIFDDPAESQPATKQTLLTYMASWQRRANAAGSTNQWILSDQLRGDNNGILTDWEWWEIVNTDLCGSALIKTNDKGVFLERITYFNRNKSK